VRGENAAFAASLSRVIDKPAGSVFHCIKLTHQQQSQTVGDLKAQSCDVGIDISESRDAVNVQLSKFHSISVMAKWDHKFNNRV